MSDDFYSINSNVSKEDSMRIQKLRIPPNWKDVQISKDPCSKVQVTGKDSRNRTQYIYHPLWVMFSKDSKYDKMKSLNFNKFKTVISKISKQPEINKDYVIANMFILMKDLNIRVGNEIYLQENDSVGLTTMSKSHFKNNKLIFKGKKGVQHEKDLSKQHLIFINKILTFPGNSLFKYCCNKNYLTVSSNDMNDFLKQQIDVNMTTKDVRTYSANIIFEKKYKELLKKGLLNQNKARIEAIKYTAEQLGNTPKVCRDSYINPELYN